MLFSRKSPFSGIIHSMVLDITDQQIHNWKFNGVFIQNAMPNLTPDEREFVKTGIYPSEWPDEAIEEELDNNGEPLPPEFNEDQYDR